MQNFIQRPNVSLYPGVRIEKDTVLDFENEHVKQHLRELILHTISTRKGEGYESTCDTVIHLNEGDVLLFEGDGRGYIKPVEGFCEIDEAIEDLVSIKDLG